MQIRLSRKVFFSVGYRQGAKWLGANYELEAILEGEVSQETGMVINLTDFDSHLKALANKVDHKFLNEDILEFRETDPTLPRFTEYLFHELKGALGESSATLIGLRLKEGEDSRFDFFVATPKTNVVD